jgi:hypothetical protein
LKGIKADQGKPCFLWAPAPGGALKKLHSPSSAFGLSPKKAFPRRRPGSRKKSKKNRPMPVFFVCSVFESKESAGSKALQAALILVSGFWLLVSGFWFPVSGFRFPAKGPDSPCKIRLHCPLLNASFRNPADD